MRQGIDNFANGLLAVLVALPLTLTACGQRGALSVQQGSRPFPAPDVPGAYADDIEGALDYLSVHFWDAFTDTSQVWKCDTALVNGVPLGDLEQAFANYAGVLEAISFSEAKKSLSELYDKVLRCERADTSSNVFETVTSLVERYFYDVNSPLRNEDLYCAYASRMTGCELIAPEKRDVYAYDVRMCSLNETGTPAADFVFCDSKGRQRSLYSIKADYILLFFSNPGCHACEEIIHILSDTLAASELIAAGRLAVLNIYIDEDLKAWYDYMPIYPEDWYNAYDPKGIIRSDVLYNVRAIPSLYLLDSEKNVIMKDAPDQRLFSFLETLKQQ